MPVWIARSQRYILHHRINAGILLNPLLAAGQKVEPAIWPSSVVDILENLVVRERWDRDMRKNVTLKVMEHWNRLPREAVESPSLQIFQTCLYKVLCSLLWVTLLRQGVGLSDPQRSLLTPTILWFCDSVKILTYYLEAVIFMAK